MTAPTWTGQHGLVRSSDEAWVGWRADLHGGSWQASIGSAAITCDWSLQNVQDYRGEEVHGVGCREGNAPPPAGTPARSSRWQGNSGSGLEILAADFSMGECRVCDALPPGLAIGRPFLQAKAQPTLAVAVPRASDWACEV